MIGLPLGVRPSVIRPGVREALRPFGLRRLRVCTTHTGHTRGFAVADLDQPEIAVTESEAIGGLSIACRTGSDGGGGDIAASRTQAQLSRCCGGKIDLMFPFVPSPVRRRLKLDSEALHSTLDEALGVHLAAALLKLCCAGGADAARLKVVDGCACCGGSTRALHGAFGGRIWAVEADKVRAELLEANLTLLCPDGRAAAVAGDFCKVWPELVPADVIFLDVPWGGPSYGEQRSIHQLALGGVPLAELLVRLAEADAARLLAVRLPYNFDVDLLARQLTEAWAGWEFAWDDALQQPERPMPFRADLGACGLLFMVCLCSLALPSALSCRATDTCGPGATRGGSLGDDGAGAASGASGWQGFRLGHLDALIEALRAWDGDAGRRHHTAFFDWEAERWVPLSRWKGCKPGLRRDAGSREELAGAELAGAMRLYQAYGLGAFGF